MVKAKKAEATEKIEEVATPVAPQKSPEPISNDKHKVDTVSSITGKTFKRYTF